MTMLSSQLPERSSVNSNAVGEQLQRSCLDVVADRAADRGAILLAMDKRCLQPLDACELLDYD